MVLKYVDLTHVLNENILMYPAPGFVSPKIKKISTINSRGCMLSSVSFISHTGTHMDAPCHFVEQGETIDAIDIMKLIVKPTIIKIAPKQKIIRVEDLMPHADRIDTKTVLILDTGIDKKYGTEEYFYDFATLNKEAAIWITKKRPAMLATDAPSVDSVNSKEKIIHKTLLNMKIIIVESITNISLINEDCHICIFLPLKIEGIDGSPCRAIAIHKEQIKNI